MRPYNVQITAHADSEGRWWALVHGTGGLAAELRFQREVTPGLGRVIADKIRVDGTDVTAEARDLVGSLLEACRGSATAVFRELGIDV